MPAHVAGAQTRVEMSLDPAGRSACATVTGIHQAVNLLCVNLLCLTAALAFGQDDLAGKSQRARQAMTDARYEEAARLYSELIDKLPQNAGLRMNLGLALHS